jgi:hypothetical protein
MQRPANNADETRQMSLSDGMQHLQESPASVTTIATCVQLPTSAEAANSGRHLWVISDVEVPFALESCAWGAKLQTGRIKHSNLTGGGNAHTGGEIWFVDGTKIVVNANSGRYGAASANEFDEVVAGFKNCGYKVASMGFDIDNPTKPNSVLIGNPEWQ